MWKRIPDELLHAINWMNTIFIFTILQSEGIEIKVENGRFYYKKWLTVLLILTILKNSF